MARKPVAGTHVLVRGLAVALLLSGLGAGVFIRVQHQPTETLSLQSATEAQTVASKAFKPPPPDIGPQSLPAGAQLKLARQESSLSKQAQSQAAARAQQVGDSIAQRAQAAAKDAKERAIAAVAAALGAGGLAPDAPTDCLSYTGVKQVGCSILMVAGFEVTQMSCLDKLWTKESHWNPLSENASSGAYGIPQALPGSKMASFGSDWKTNPVPQIKWGLKYIQDRYTTPCGAWAHSQRLNWY
ncbi:MAG: hypothetical protein ACR2JX_02020 [Mycobacteriales bacterium]